MRGDLVETTAADVCRELAARGASGILAIDGPGGPGRVVLIDGRIIAAVSPTPRARLGDRLVGAGELDPDDLADALAIQREEIDSLPLGSLLVDRELVRRDAVRVFVQEQVLDALFEIVRWRYGAFAFNAGDAARDQGVPLSLSVDDALVEVARRQQEWRELSQVIPDLDSVPSFRAGAASANASLEPDEFAVLASVDGVRSVRALAADLGYGEFEAARIVYGLSLLGIVDVRPPQDEIGAALEDALGLADFEEPTPEATTVASTTGPSGADDPVDQPFNGRAGDSVTTGDDTGDDAAAVGGDTEQEEPALWVSSAPEGPASSLEDEAQAPSDPAAFEADLEVPTASEEPASGSPAAASEPAAAADPMQDQETTGSDDADAGNDADGFDDLADLDRFADAAGSQEPPAGSQEPPAAPIFPPSSSPPPPPVPADDTPGSTSPPAGADRSAEQPAPDPVPWNAVAEAPGQGAPSPADPSEEVAATTGPTSEEAAPAARRGDDADVSEFLRELSRLSVDAPTDGNSPRPPSRSGPPSNPDNDAGKGDAKGKKRRGLFGRG